METTCQEFRDKIDDKNKNIVKIFSNMLNLNPYFRMSAVELLEDEVFDRMRDMEKEKALQKMKDSAKKKDLEYMIFLPFDEHDAFDYENPINSKFSADQLKMMLVEEIKDLREP